MLGQPMSKPSSKALNLKWTLDLTTVAREKTFNQTPPTIPKETPSTHMVITNKYDNEDLSFWL